MQGLTLSQQSAWLDPKAKNYTLNGCFSPYKFEPSNVGLEEVLKVVEDAVVSLSN